MQSFGVVVRARRRAAGLSLSELAVRAGCSKSYLSDVENGHRLPGPGVIVGVERALGLDAGILARIAALDGASPVLRAELVRLCIDRDLAERMAAVIRTMANPPVELAQLAAWFGEPRSGPEPRRTPNAIPVTTVLGDDLRRGGRRPASTPQHVCLPSITDPDAFGAIVTSDAMAPDYLAGDIIIAGPASPVTPGCDCIVRTDDHASPMLRRIYPAARQRIRLMALDPAREPLVVRGDAWCLGRVVAVVRWI